MSMQSDRSSGDVEACVRRFMVEGLGIAAVASMADDESLLSSDVIDSTAVLELATFLQATFGIEIRDDELVPANLDSIAAVAAFVARKRVQAQAA